MATIYVTGLGPGDMSALPVGTYEKLRSGLPIYLRTAVHPVVEDLRRQGFEFQSFDDFYEHSASFDEVYVRIADTLAEHARVQGAVVYAVPGHPLMAEQSVQLLLQRQDVDVEIVAGQSFLDATFTAAGIDPVEGFLLLDGTNIRVEQYNPRLHTFIVQVYHPSIASDVKLALMEVLPDDHPVRVIRAAGVADMQQVVEVPLYELDRLDWIDHLTTVYVPPAADDEILYRDPWFVAGLVRRLREPDGCPWDREQTHQTLRPYVIEEAYEVAHAIDKEDAWGLCDELGDLLLQVLLHAQIASEYGDFSVRDVYAALADKLVRRHPHVFGSVHADTGAEAHRHWSAVKAQETAGERAESLMDAVKWGRPPFRVAEDVQRRAAEVGFDWPNAREVLAKVREEVDELAQELQNRGNCARTAEELGDLLFSVSNLARWLNVDPEEALLSATRKFVQRFRVMEEKIKENQGDIANTPSSDLEKYWNKAKSVGKHTTDSLS